MDKDIELIREAAAYANKLAFAFIAGSKESEHEKARERNLLALADRMEAQEPVAWRYMNEKTKSWATTTSAIVASAMSDGGRATEPLFTHADTGEVASLKLEVERLKAERDDYFVRWGAAQSKKRKLESQLTAIKRAANKAYRFESMSFTPPKIVVDLEDWNELINSIINPPNVTAEELEAHLEARAWAAGFNACRDEMIAAAPTPPAANAAQDKAMKLATLVRDTMIRRFIHHYPRPGFKVYMPDIPDNELSQIVAEVFGTSANAAQDVVTIPVKPTDGLLMSMALRYDNGLCLPGYYDQFPRWEGDSHATRLNQTISDMKKLHEEVVGAGFYRPEKEAEYVALKTAAPEGGK